MKRKDYLVEKLSISYTQAKQIEKESKSEEIPTPVEEYNYKENQIEVYGTYSKVNGNIKEQIYNVRNGKLFAMQTPKELNIKQNNIENTITDSYNGKEYQTILNNEGELVDLKEKLHYPSNFLNSNIKQIVQNESKEKPEIMVMYNTGKIIVFNYVTGEKVYETEEKAYESLASYIGASIANIWNDYESKQIEYEKSKKLAEKLKESQ